MDTVIKLLEQQRMKDDSEYADAVQRFMGDTENLYAAVIVNTNLVWEVLNMEKAQSLCNSSMGPNLILCATCDISPSAHGPLS